MKMFEYRKLKGRIVEKYGTFKAFYAVIGISEMSGSNKLNCKSGFSQKDIIKWSDPLDIDLKDVGSYFYT